MSAKDGGPAFPVKGKLGWDSAGVTQVWRADGGMSLRDWFAGQALAGITAHKADWSDRGNVAKWAYAYADEMLTERDR